MVRERRDTADKEGTLKQNRDRPPKRSPRKVALCFLGLTAGSVVAVVAVNVINWLLLFSSHPVYFYCS